MPGSSAIRPTRIHAIAGAIFFVSGFPALIYQLVWQRALYTIYGINIESVSIIVAAFMLGLGLGSFIGGLLSRIHRVSPLVMFALIELGIGLYGLLSLTIIEGVGIVTLGSSTLLTGVLSLAVVLAPTLLMGATLPILVSFLVRSTNNVGRAVGALYFANTLGSATACIVLAHLLMRQFGMLGTVAVAASLNLMLAATAAVVAKRLRSRNNVERTAIATTTKPATAATHVRMPMPLGFAALLAGLSGFVALSFEIVWFRVYAVSNEGRAPVLAFLLAAYLGGIALGSLAAERYCVKNTPPHAARAFMAVMFCGSIVAFAVAPATAWLMPWPIFKHPILVTFAAALMGAAFPLLCHIAVPADMDAGRKTSLVYLANIVGSTLGSLVTGLVLLERLSLSATVTTLALIGLGTVLLASSRTPGNAWGRQPLVAGVLTTAAVLIASQSFIFDRFWERLHWMTGLDEPATLAAVVENRHGVIAVTDGGTVYGGGVYDGKFSVDLVDDVNWVVRPFSISAFHPAPRDVLMIGLSSGSWAQIVANNPEVRSLTIVEINSGYRPLVAAKPLVRSLLENPKVSFEIDDGRRWLNRNTQRKFDLILMNTTYHWRSNATNLLSMEFLELVRQHLLPGGMAHYNTTGSERAMHTAVEVFPHVLRFYNMVYVSDTPIVADRERWARILDAYEIDGRLVLDPRDPVAMRRRTEVLALLDTLDAYPAQDEGLESRDSLTSRTAGLETITDDNMGDEWKPTVPGWPLLRFYRALQRRLSSTN